MPRTELASERHPMLDRYTTADLVAALADDQREAVAAVQAVIAPLAQVVDAALPRLQAGGRLIYVGAGTSGRLGVLDSVELPPTFSWPRERAVAVLAGGLGAMFQSAEGAEDDGDQGAADLRALGPGAHDVVLLLAASGATPFVLGALRAARAAGSLTVGLANSPGAPLATGADIGIVLDTGPEAISGSTRLKAGTAQKIALNTLSSALMVRLHKVHGNLMVDLRATNAKLRARAVRLAAQASGADAAAAQAALARCDWRVKVAIVMLRCQCDADAAQARLLAAGGSVHGALQD
nr:N-acetylmuramic acid 6-phosphate etherase [Ideonella sp. A 288]